MAGGPKDDPGAIEEAERQRQVDELGQWARGEINRPGFLVPNYDGTPPTIPQSLPEQAGTAPLQAPTVVQPSPEAVPADRAMDPANPMLVPYANSLSQPDARAPREPYSLPAADQALRARGDLSAVSEGQRAVDRFDQQNETAAAVQDTATQPAPQRLGAPPSFGQSGMLVPPGFQSEAGPAASMPDAGPAVGYSKPQVEPQGPGWIEGGPIAAVNRAGVAVDKGIRGALGMALPQAPGTAPGLQPGAPPGATDVFGVSARDSATARALDEQRAQQAANATPATGADLTPETITSIAAQRNQAALDNLAMLQDKMVASANMAGAAGGGRASAGLWRAYAASRDAYNNAQQHYNDTFRQEELAVQGQQVATIAGLEVQSEWAKQHAQIITDNITAQRQASQIALADTDARGKQIDREIGELRTRKVDPSRVFQNMGSGGRIAFIFAAAADGFARGHGINTGLWDNFNAIIDRDVKSQEGEITSRTAALEDRYKALNIARTHMTDESAQREAAYMAEMEASKAIVEGLLLKTDEPKQKALYDQIIAQIERQRLDHSRAMYAAQADAQMKSIRVQQGAPLRAMKERLEMAKLVGEIMEKRQKIGMEAGAGGLPPPSPETVRIISEKYADLYPAQMAMGRLMQSLRANPPPGMLLRLGAAGKWTTAAIPTQYVQQYGDIIQAFMDYRKAITGQQAPFAELERIEKAFSGYGDATTPEEINARVGSMFTHLQNQIAGTLAPLGAPTRAALQKQISMTLQELGPNPIPQAPITRAP